MARILLSDQADDRPNRRANGAGQLAVHTYGTEAVRSGTVVWSGAGTAVVCQVPEKSAKCTKCNRIGEQLQLLRAALVDEAVGNSVK